MAKKKTTQAPAKTKSPLDLGKDFAQKIRKSDSRFDYFWNYVPIPKLMEPDGFFRSKKRTKCVIGANKSTKTTASVFEAVMIYTGIVPPSMQGVYAHEEKLRELVEGENRRPRRVRIIVQNYSKHFPETIRPLLLGDPDKGEEGMLPEDWSQWSEAEHMFTGPDGSFLSIFAADPMEEVDPNLLRGPLIDHTLIDERTRRSIYTESLVRSATLSDGPRTCTLAFCPQDGFEDWTYNDLYGASYNLLNDERWPTGSPNLHPDIDAYRVSMRDNPSITPETIESLERSFKPYERAYRVHGMYSSRAANPYFNMDTLVQIEKEKRTTDGKPIKLDIVEANPETGVFVGKVDFLDHGSYDEAHEAIWRMWEFPKNGHKYMVSADTAMGNSTSDYQASGIWRCTMSVIAAQTGQEVIKPAPFPFQVGQLRMRELKPGDYAVQCCMMAHYFGDCLLAYESNTESGGIVIDRSRNYANLYKRSKREKGDEQETQNYGWHSDRYTKPMMLEALYRLVQASYSSGQFPIRSFLTLAELMSFEERVVKDKHGDVMRVETGNRPGAHDDTVMEAAIAAYIQTEEFHKLTTCNFSEAVVTAYHSELEEQAAQTSSRKAFGGMKKRPSISTLRRQSHGRRSNG